MFVNHRQVLKKLGHKYGIPTKTQALLQSIVSTICTNWFSIGSYMLVYRLNGNTNKFICLYKLEEKFNSMNKLQLCRYTHINGCVFHPDSRYFPAFKCWYYKTNKPALVVVTK